MVTWNVERIISPRREGRMSSSARVNANFRAACDGEVEVRTRGSNPPCPVAAVLIFSRSFLENLTEPRATEQLHRIAIDVVGDRFANAVADLDCTRVVHSTPYSRVIAVGACLRNAGIRTARQTGRRQRKNLSWPELTQENGGSTTI